MENTETKFVVSHTDYGMEGKQAFKELIGKILDEAYGRSQSFVLEMKLGADATAPDLVKIEYTLKRVEIG